MGVSIGFDSTGKQASFGAPPPIPLNEYNVLISDSGKEKTTAGDGEYLYFDLKIIDGPQAGRVQTHRLNLWNKNADTVRIAEQQLAGICHVTKKYKFGNTEELHGIPFRAVIGPQVKDGKESDKYSEVKELKNADGSKPGTGSAAPAPASSAPVFGAPATTSAAPAFGPPAIAAAPPAPAAATPPAPVVVQSPMDRAKADGWTPHTDPAWAATHMYKGQEVKANAEVEALYAAPAAAMPPAPAGPPAPAAAPAFGAPAPAGGNPPWAVQS